MGPSFKATIFYQSLDYLEIVFQIKDITDQQRVVLKHNKDNTKIK